MDLFKFQILSSMEKVMPKREPAASAEQLQLSGLRSEILSFQIGYYWAGEERKYGKISVKTPEGVLGTVRIVGLVPCAYPCHRGCDEDYLSTEPGIYPDILEEMPACGFPLIPKQWRSLWVDLEITDTAPAGRKTVQIGLDIEEMQIEEDIGIELQVLDASLPPLSIPHTEWLHCDCLADYYNVAVFSERHWEIIENYVRTAVKRGINMIYTPIFTPPLDTAFGGERTTVQLIDIGLDGTKYSFGFDRFERWVKLCEDCGARYFEMAHLFTQWGAKYCPKIVVTKDGREQKLFGWESRADSPEYAEFLSQFLPSLTEKIEEMGIGGRCYFHISDEPRREDMESYKAARDLVRPYLKTYPVIDAISDYALYREGIVDEPVCSNDHIQPFLENRPKKLWTYYCTGQDQLVSNRFIVMPGYRTRIIGTQMYRFQIDGFLHWGYNFYNSAFSYYPVNPYLTTDAAGSFPSGDPFLVYPGKDGKPVESMRLMLMDEAMNDFRALQYLEELTDRETALSCLGDEGEALTFDSYPHCSAYLIKVRARVNEEIERVSHAGVSEN